MKSTTRKLASFVAMSAIAVVSQNVQANSSTYYFYDGAQFPSYLTGTIRVDTNNSYTSSSNSGYEKTLNVGAGGFKMTPDLDGDRYHDTNETKQSIIGWCVDVFHGITSASYTKGTLTDLNAYINSQINPDNKFNQSNLQKFVNQNYANVLNKSTSVDQNYSAAFQLAVWEIVNETSGIYNLTDGSFKASGFTSGSGSTFFNAVQTAQTWLSLINDPKTKNTGNYNIAYLFNPNGATQNLITMSAVPLPAAGWLMLSALGLGGWFTRRRASKEV